MTFFIFFKISLTENVIPWLFPDLEFFSFSRTFSLTVATLIIDNAGFIQASLCKIQGLFKDFFKNLPALFKDYKIMKNIELHIQILLPKC